MEWFCAWMHSWYTVGGRMTIVWISQLDELTCDECRALHGKSIDDIGFAPPLHGLNDKLHRKPCRCTVKEVVE